jgi:hypothetical protein
MQLQDKVSYQEILSMHDSALIEATRDFNRFYTNFIGVLNKAYLDTPFTLTDARVLFEIGSHESISAVTLARRSSSRRGLSQPHPQALPHRRADREQT